MRIFLGLLLLIIGGSVYAAFPPKVRWIPAELKPESIAPGESATYTVTLKHTGRRSIRRTNQLKVVAEGDIASFVTIRRQRFPPVFKRGKPVKFSVIVSVPPNTPLSVKNGELVLKRILRNGKVKKVWRSDKLPVELTFSSFRLPPAPDPIEDEATIEGVDTDENGVPDRVDRWIGFEAPNSEKKRKAMTLSAKTQQDFFHDYLAHLGEDPEAENVRIRVRAMADIRAKADDCLQYVLGANVGFDVPGARETWYAYNNKRKEVQALFMDTPERLRAFQESERPLVATGYPSIPDDQYKQQCLDLGFNPDQLPN